MRKTVDSQPNFKIAPCVFYFGTSWDPDGVPPFFFKWCFGKLIRGAFKRMRACSQLPIPALRSDVYSWLPREARPPPKNYECIFSLCDSYFSFNDKCKFARGWMHLTGESIRVSETAPLSMCVVHLILSSPSKYDINATGGRKGKGSQRASGLPWQKCIKKISQSALS
jgi:hypothetical protein